MRVICVNISFSGQSAAISFRCVTHLYVGAQNQLKREAWKLRICNNALEMMLRWFGDLCAAVQGCDATGEAITTKAWLIKVLIRSTGLVST